MGAQGPEHEGGVCRRCGATSDLQWVKYEKEGQYFSEWWCGECKAERLLRRRRDSEQRAARERRKLRFPFLTR